MNVKTELLNTKAGVCAVLLSVAIITGCGGSTTTKQVDNEEDLTTDNEKLSYALGLFFGTQAKIFNDLDMELLVAGLRDSYTEKENVIYNEKQIGEIIISNQQQALQNRAEDSAVKTEEFLNENAQDERFTILESGLRYRIITEADGPKPKESDTVEVHYRGTLTNGEEFDSSYQRNQTAVFPVNGVIVGWQEALQIMPVGSTWEIVIPPELAYGERGNGGIGPNEVLIFELNLIGIK